jgi:hypothetical protein
MKVFNKGICIALCVLALSCKNDEKSKTDDSDIRFRYFNLEKQGWKSKKHLQKADGINFEATEVPIQYYLLKKMGNSDLIKVDSIYEVNKTERVIEFTFEQDNEEDLLQEKYTDLNYEKSVEYMSFNIQNDFTVITSKHDTIVCTGVLFERTFKIAPKNKLLLFFSGINPNEHIQLVYQDKLFKTGTLKFRFKDPILKL